MKDMARLVRLIRLICIAGGVSACLMWGTYYVASSFGKGAAPRFQQTFDQVVKVLDGESTVPVVDSMGYSAVLDCPDIPLYYYEGDVLCDTVISLELTFDHSNELQAALEADQFYHFALREAFVSLMNARLGIARARKETVTSLVLVTFAFEQVQKTFSLSPDAVSVKNDPAPVFDFTLGKNDEK